MAVESNYTPRDGGGRPGDIEPLLDEVQDLTWALLDENINSDDFARLEQVLGDEEEAREAYLDCVQLHVDLQRCFDDEPAEVPSSSPLLGFLETAISPLSAPPHPSDSGC